MSAYETLTDAERRDITISFKVTDDEYRFLLALARQQHRPIAEIVRDLALLAMPKRQPEKAAC
jgi:hypothetical protein